MQDVADIPPVIADYQRERLTPIAASERIETIDMLRGIALLGILAVNMVSFSWPMEMTITQRQFRESVPNVLVDWVVQFLTEGKFYPLFSFLFGLGAAIQMQRAESRETNFTGRFCRRLLALLGFGLVHALFIWDGDILIWYALCGFLLLPFRKRQPKTVLTWAAACLLIPAMLVGLLWAILVMASAVPELAKGIQEALAQYSNVSNEQIDETIRVFATGSYGEMFRARWATLIFIWTIGPFYCPEFLALFLLGLYAGQRRIFQDVETNKATIRRVLIWGLIIGLPINLFYTLSLAYSDASDTRYLWLLGYALATVGGPAQSLAYGAAITLLVRHELWKKWLRPAGSCGRMALSNYLLQSLICTTIFYSYGLGLFGAVDRVSGLGLAVLIYVFQIGFSMWWLNRFQFGPIEWLWRTLTYGKLQPMRR